MFSFRFIEAFDLKRVLSYVVNTIVFTLQVYFARNTSRIILDLIVRESLHHFPFAILSDNRDNFVLE